MVKVKNITDSELSCEWLPGGQIGPGETVEVPDTQPDGSPLLWSPDYFEIVTDKPAAAVKAKAKE